MEHRAKPLAIWGHILKAAVLAAEHDENWFWHGAIWHSSWLKPLMDRLEGDKRESVLVPSLGNLLGCLKNFLWVSIQMLV